MAQATVLVVEDDAVVAGCIEDALRLEGYRVVVEAGSDPVAVAPSIQPDVIVLDLMTAGIDGVEVSRRLRASPATAARRLCPCPSAWDAARSLCPSMRACPSRAAWSRSAASSRSTRSSTW